MAAKLTFVELAGALACRKHMRLALLAIALVATAPSWADEAEDADEDADEAKDLDGDPAEPRLLSVDAALVGTNVRMTARFEIDVAGPAVGMKLHGFALPAHAVVTAASVVVDGARHRMRLELANAVDRRFDALTLKPSTGDRAWAFALAAGFGSVTLDVLAPRPARAIVELVLELPTCFYADARFVELPGAWWKRVPAAQRRAVRVNDDEVAEACSRSDFLAGNRWLGLASRQLASRPAGAKRLGVVAGRLPLSSIHVARVELDIARTLSNLPRDLHTAIVIDHSRSMTLDELEAQRAIVAAYLRAAPTSRVQVIGYARRARALLPSWMVASRAAPRVDREIRALAPRNGSNVDDALAAAASWLARVHGTKRILLFSDERLAERLAQPANLLASVPDGTLVHVVRPDAGALVRDDDMQLGVVAEATKGIAVRGGPDDDGALDATMLVRPTSLDQIVVGELGWQTNETIHDERACGDTLREGHSCVWWGEGSAAAGPIAVRARLWNTEVVRVVRADPAQARALARVLTLAQDFEHALQAEIDRVALAVNSVWSLFVQWGGSGGYEDVGGFGSIGGGSFRTSSHDHVIGTIGRGRLVSGLDLRRQLAPALASCRAGSARVEVSVETTREEIVEVAVDTEDVALRDCIVEAVWELTLRIPDAPAHATTRVSFGLARP